VAEVVAVVDSLAQQAVEAVTAEMGYASLLLGDFTQYQLK